MSKKEIKKDSVVRDWMRGGQTIMHDFRMMRQVLKNMLIFGVIFVIIYTLIYGYYNTNSYDKYVAKKYFFSWVLKGISPKKKVEFMLKNKKTIKVSHNDILRQKPVIKIANKVFNVYKKGIFQSGIIFIIAIISITFIIRRRGKKQRSDKFLRGGILVSDDEFKNNFKKRINKVFNMGVMPFLEYSETKHSGIIGTTGAGKSVSLKYLIKSIRKNGDRAMIYSTSYEFIENFYQDDKDIILNPLDERCPKWNIWAETQEIYHYDNIASAIIPDEEGDKNQPFWSNASRTLFANAARKMKQSGNYSTKELLLQMLTVDQEEIAKIVKSTEAAALVKEGMESVALSIRAELSTHLKSLKYLRESKDADFSIRDWVTNESEHQGEWVFISRSADQADSLRSLITCWISIFADAALSLPENEDRRFWLIIDEFPSLNRLKALENLMGQGRKYGLCVVLGAQTYSQIEVIYGAKGAQALFGLLNNVMFLRQNDEKDAEWSSKQLGKEEIKATQEGLSMGANEFRDGVSINEQEKVRSLVLSSEIINLDDLEGYYKLPGNIPTVKCKQIYWKPPIVAQGFIRSKHQDHVYMLESDIDDKDSEQKPKKKQQRFNKNGDELFDPNDNSGDADYHNPPDWLKENTDNNQANKTQGGQTTNKKTKEIKKTKNSNNIKKTRPKGMF